MTKKYDPAYKPEVCKPIASRASAATSRETGINDNTLYIWMKRYNENKEKPFVGSGHVLPENEEMVRLRRECRDLRGENEILKRRQLTLRRTKGKAVRVYQGVFPHPLTPVSAIWFCVASNFVGNRAEAPHSPPRLRTTQNQIALLVDFAPLFVSFSCVHPARRVQTSSIDAK